MGVDGCTTTAGEGPRLTRRVIELGVEGAFAVFAEARRLQGEGRDVVHLEVGEPDFPTPAHIVEAGVRALRDGLTTYVQSSGIPELRSAIAASMAERDVTAEPANVVVTPGSKLMVFLALQALVEPGDEVLLPDPAYPAYAAVTGFIGARAVPYLVDAYRGMDVAEVAAKITPRTRVLVINSPHNPTGHALDRAALEQLAALAERHDLTVMSDEIYRHLSFGAAPPVSIASLPGMSARTIIVDGFSKAYAMTGWRLGYGVMPVRLAEMVGKLVNNSAACTAPFVQVAGVAALTGPQDNVRAMCAEFRLRRDLIVSTLNAMPGVKCATPGGAFYVFPDIAGTGMRGEALAHSLLYDAGVACLPGTAFGVNGDHSLRFSYVRSRGEIERAMGRMAKRLA
jgi:aspartate aminotransferase